ncbi:MAG: glycosyltransferase family 2 protein [Pseudonocardia sp.]
MSDVLVSVGIPVRNGEHRVRRAAEAVLGQTHRAVRLVISDNASDDGTEDVCRELARDDARVRYVRQPHDIGILANFDRALRLADGEFFKWLGDDDLIGPTYLERCLAEFAAHPGLVLVTTGQTYAENDGQVRSASYGGTRLRAPDRVVRLDEMLRLLTSSHLLLDPVYGLMRRRAALRVPMRTMLRQDQLFATRMALEGPWGHVPEVLAHRGWTDEPRSVLVRRLGVPRWYRHAATALQLAELGRDLRDVGLTRDEWPRAGAAALRWYARWHGRRITDGVRRRVTPGRRTVAVGSSPA